MNPYSNTKPYQRWSSAVADRYFTDIDWTLEKRFEISKTDKIISLGSCFAQHIARSLLQSGYNYLFAPESAAQSEARTFSARYGNVYSVRQARQLLERAFGVADYTLSTDSWLSHSGKIIDPFRPNEFPNGFDTEAEMLDERRKHLDNVREIFSSADVIIFTLGLTETWLDIKSGAALPVAPGVYGGPWPSANYQFTNFSYVECESDLREFVSIIKRINPRARIILTVSPVSLVATMENQSVAISTCHSKSVLRAVAGDLSRAHVDIFYFPSYEIITNPASAGLLFDGDFRSVKDTGVAIVMKSFNRFFFSTTKSQKTNLSSGHVAVKDSVVCDEDVINSLL